MRAAALAAAAAATECGVVPAVPAAAGDAAPPHASSRLPCGVAGCPRPRSWVWAWAWAWARL